jgi:hypothetical protein
MAAVLADISRPLLLLQVQHTLTLSAAADQDKRLARLGLLAEMAALV